MTRPTSFWVKQDYKNFSILSHIYFVKQILPLVLSYGAYYLIDIDEI